METNNVTINEEGNPIFFAMNGVMPSSTPI
jgi:hypothetical protein